MYKKVREWDECCIVFFEKICHWIQMWTGITCFTIAKLLVLLSVLGKITSTGSIWIQLAGAAFDTLCGIYTVVFAESRTKTVKGFGFVNPLRLIPLLFYLRFFTFSRIMGDILFRHEALKESVGYWIFLFVVVCTPLPPGPSKLNTWFRSLIPPENTAIEVNS